jgi:hypothetical protein
VELLVSGVPVRGVSRRTVVSGLAWTVPAIAVAGAAPALAASTGQSVVVTQGTAVVASGAVRSNSGGYGFDSSGFTSMGDADSTSTDTVLTASYSFSAAAATTYQVSFSVTMRPCVPNASSQRQNLTVDAVLGSTTTLARVGLKHAAINGTSKLVVADASMGTHDLLDAGTPKAYATTFLATTAGTLTIRLTFTLVARPGTGWGNDDVWVTTPVVTREI